MQSYYDNYWECLGKQRRLILLDQTDIEFKWHDDLSEHDEFWSLPSFIKTKLRYRIKKETEN